MFGSCYISGQVAADWFTKDPGATILQGEILIMLFPSVKNPLNSFYS